MRKTTFDLSVFHDGFHLWLCFRTHCRKARHACGMNKKGQFLVYLGQIKYETAPHKQHENLKFLECENANKN